MDAGTLVRSSLGALAGVAWRTSGIGFAQGAEGRSR